MNFLNSDWPFSVGGNHPLNHQMLAKGNRRSVLGLISRNKCLSQKEISRRTSLRASTVSNIIRQLKEMRLIQEGSTISAERAGPKETALEIAPEYAWSVGLSLDQHCRLVAINAAGHILEQIDLSPVFSLPQLLETLPRLLTEIQARQRLSSSSFAGIGVSVAGVVDSSRGVVLLSRVLHERLFPLRSALEEALGVPVWIERNVICGAYAEHCAGAALGVDSFLYFSIGHYADESCGFGLASVVEEKIVRGSHSAAGEIDFLLERLLPSIYLARNSKPTDSFCRSCGEAVAIIVNLLDIDCVVLASNEMEITGERQSVLETSISEKLVSVPGRVVNVKRSTLQVNGPLLGSALLILHRKMAGDLMLQNVLANGKSPKGRRLVLAGD